MTPPPGQHLPADHSKGDEGTLGGYMAVHARPAAFEGADGLSYSADIATDATGEHGPGRRAGAYLLFVRWTGDDPKIGGHVESGFLTFADTDAEAREALGRWRLADVKQLLDRLIAAPEPPAPAPPAAPEAAPAPARAAVDPAASGERGVVLSGTGGIWVVRTAAGETREVSLRGRLKQAGTLKLAVGDEVVLESGERGDGWVIREILPRRSTLARQSPAGARGERLVAANVDQVVAVFAAANPEPHTRMLDRFLIIAEGNSLAARIIINKIELVQPDEVRARFDAYQRAGYPVHYTSVKRGIGIEELHAVLDGRTSVFSGPSGVGKSSLLNTLYPGLNLRVGEISASVNKGRHTTVGALMHPLPRGGFVVDTPGLREVGMWGLPPEHLDRCFPEFRPMLGECKFRDCAHTVEPGCAVLAGVRAGTISAARHDSYAKLHAELVSGTPAW